MCQTLIASGPKNGGRSVEYFHPYKVPERIQVAQQVLKPAIPLPVGAMIYWRDGQDRWQIGQIRASTALDCTIEWAGGRKVLRANEVHVPCDGDVAEVMSMLAWQTFTSPTFHSHRVQFLKSVLRMREATVGMSALASSRIMLLSHQVEIVRQVLADPVQRYLLADEVGLGKTIEAGIILRQFLLDHPREEALLLAPPFLLQQWKRELYEKFTLADLGINRVTRISPAELTRQIEARSWGMVIVDEAHHVASGAFSSDSAAKETYERLNRIAQSTARILLLSATPVLHHEQNFLAMLHLLDQSVYKLADLPSFKHRVANRQRVGQILLMLREDADPFLVKLQMEELRSLAADFADDTTLQSLVSTLGAIVDPSVPAVQQPVSILGAIDGEHNANDADLETPLTPETPEVTAQTDSRTERERVTDALRSLRVHINEAYRLHRRLLRTRREILDPELLPRRMALQHGGNILDSIGLADHDPRIEAAEKWLEAWREAAVLQSAADHLKTRDLSAVYVKLAEGVAGDFGRLRAAASNRLQQQNAGPCRAMFEGEDLLLRELIEISESTAGGSDRTAQLCNVIGAASSEKTIVFASSTDHCERVVTMLAQRLGEAAVASHHHRMPTEDVESEIRRFVEQRECHVLICDESGEEGRNLQAAKRLIHLDLPWSPNRIEQRTGRLDRIGQESSLSTVVFTGPDGMSITRAWCAIMADGFHVFDRSIAGLQFFVDRVMPELAMAAFQEGPDGLLSRIPRVREEIEEEQRRNEEQYALDEMDATGITGKDYIQRLEAFESQPDQIQQSVDDWACSGLGLRCSVVDATKRIVRYEPSAATVLSSAEVEQFRPLINARGTYDRDVATHERNVRLFRLGEPFIEALAALPHTDDRGKTYGIIRHVSDWGRCSRRDWAGFCFTFLVRAALQTEGMHWPRHVASPGTTRELQRLSETFFPPMLRQIHVTTDGVAENDETVLTLLRRPGDDCILAGREQEIARFVDPTYWSEVCGKCLEGAETAIRNTGAFVEACTKRRDEAAIALNERLMRLRVRHEIEHRSNEWETLADDDLLAEEALVKMVLSGITTPEFQLDSVGFLVLSPDKRRGGNLG